MIANDTSLFSQWVQRAFYFPQYNTHNSQLLHSVVITLPHLCPASITKISVVLGEIPGSGLLLFTLKEATMAHGQSL